MFLRCSGEFMSAWAMSPQVGPTPTFSPSDCQLDGARLAMAVLWKMWPALAMVPDQARAIPRRSPLVPSGATPAEERAALSAETKHDSSPALAAEAGTMVGSTTAPTVAAIMRLPTVRTCLTGGLLRRSGSLPRRGGRSMTLRPRVTPGLPFSSGPGTRTSCCLSYYIGPHQAGRMPRAHHTWGCAGTEKPEGWFEGCARY